MIFTTFPAGTAVNPFTSRTDRKTLYASSTLTFFGERIVTRPFTAGSTTKFFWVKSLINLIRTPRSTSLKFMVISPEARSDFSSPMARPCWAKEKRKIKRTTATICFPYFCILIMCTSPFSCSVYSKTPALFTDRLHLPRHLAPFSLVDVSSHLFFSLATEPG